MSFRLKSATALALVAFLPTQALLAQTPGPNVIASPSPAASGAPKMLIFVPFESPDNTDTQLEFASTEFIKKMREHGYQMVETPVMDHVDAAAGAAALCQRFSGSGVLIGTARHEQRLNWMLGSYPTHAEVRITQLNCAGQPVWRGNGVGDQVYYWSNAGAAVSAEIDKALDSVVDQYIPPKD